MVTWAPPHTICNPLLITFWWCHSGIPKASWLVRQGASWRNKVFGIRDSWKKSNHITIYKKVINSISPLNHSKCCSIEHRNENDKNFNSKFNAVKYWVIVKKSSPKNLSADCRSTVGRQLTDRLPTVYRQLTMYISPTVGRQVFWGTFLHNYQILTTIFKILPVRVLTLGK